MKLAHSRFYKTNILEFVSSKQSYTFIEVLAVETSYGDSYVAIRIIDHNYTWRALNKAMSHHYTWSALTSYNWFLYLEVDGFGNEKVCFHLKAVLKNLLYVCKAIMYWLRLCNYSRISSKLSTFQMTSLLSKHLPITSKPWYLRF